MGSAGLRLLAVAGLAAGAAGAACARAADGIRPFPDRPVAWHEHDDGHVPRRPAPTDTRRRFTAGLRAATIETVEYWLSLPTIRPAEDVNALDEVPCSTWFCPRNHLRPLTPAEAAAGPAGPGRPRPPLAITSGKSDGAQPGFVARDARGVRYLVKLDPPGHLGLATGAEIVGSRVFHAAGYHVPSSHVLELAPGELRIDEGATWAYHGYASRPLTPGLLADLTRRAAWTTDGRLRVVAVAWLPGESLGWFRFQGRRAGDPNDRIPHERRRSLRATWFLYAWLAVGDAGEANTLDTWVEEDGRRFVRHHIIDFGAALGSSTTEPKHPHEGAEHLAEPWRTARALAGLGTYRRSWQQDREAWRRAIARHPAIGWFPAEGWDPASYRASVPTLAHGEITPADAYWGAKIVTSFTDAQLAAIVAAAAYPSADDAATLLRALRARRDAIGRRTLRAVTAVEEPVVSPAGDELCFRDLALERGYARAEEVTYTVALDEGDGRPRVVGRFRPRTSATCVPVPATGAPYRVLGVRASVGGAPTTPARVHVRLRPTRDVGSSVAVVVGVERP